MDSKSKCIYLLCIYYTPLSNDQASIEDAIVFYFFYLFISDISIVNEGLSQGPYTITISVEAQTR